MNGIVRDSSKKAKSETTIHVIACGAALVLSTSGSPSLKVPIYSIQRDS